MIFIFVLESKPKKKLNSTRIDWPLVVIPTQNNEIPYKGETFTYIFSHYIKELFQFKQLALENSTL